MNQYNENGNKHGYWEWKFDFSCKIRQSGFYENGYCHGKWTEYNLDGKIELTENYIKNQRIGFRFKNYYSGRWAEKIFYI
jgi:antitoxin component YwqK of YwqJK toxin-antitoxin module